MSRVHIGLVTGGPDALHQMVYYLNQLGINAYVVYSDIKSHKYTVPEPYKIYVNDYLLLSEIEDSEKNCIIVPEILTNLLSDYPKSKKYIWWLSVDNDANLSGFFNKIKKIFKKISIKNLKKLYKINTLKNLIMHKKYDFSKDENVEHLCASYYAFDYVTKNVKDNSKIHLCIEPISKIFLDKSKFITENKEDIILYNPKKNVEFTKKIINKAKDLKFIPLTGYTQDQLINIYQRAKVYIDFGNFPGAERIPKEAVINGCCIITGKYGASAYYEDVPIKFKIDANEENIDKIIQQIKMFINNYGDFINEFSEYRETVWELENNFINQLKKIFVK